MRAAALLLGLVRRLRPLHTRILLAPGRSGSARSLDRAGPMKLVARSEHPDSFPNTTRGRRGVQQHVGPRPARRRVCRPQAGRNRSCLLIVGALVACGPGACMAADVGIDIEISCLTGPGSDCDVKAYLPTSSTCDSWATEMTTDSAGNSLSSLPQSPENRTLQFDAQHPCLKLFYADDEGDLQIQSAKRE